MSDIEWYLLNWSRWMRSGESPAMLPKMSIGLTGFTNYGETDYDTVDLNAALLTDACIRDLLPVESSAIHNAYLDCVYRFREPYEQVIERATQHLQQILERRGVYVSEQPVDKPTTQAYLPIQAH